MANASRIHMSDPDEPPGESMHSEEAAPSAPLPSSPARLGDQIRPALLSVLVLTLLTGCVFPLLLSAIGRPLFPREADGSLLERGGVAIGSELIGQEFSRPEYFHSRLSAAGKGYDETSSGGANLGPNNPKLKDGSADFAGIAQLADEYRKLNGLARDAAIPIDAVTRSASGLDPDISLQTRLFRFAVWHVRAASVKRFCAAWLRIARRGASSDFWATRECRSSN
jgi:potassium-transporting ATPase KdpC subunit